MLIAATKYRTKTGETRWRGRYSVMVDGRQKRYLVTGATAKEVLDTIRVRLDAIKQGAPVRGDKVSFGEFARTWRDSIVPTEGLAPSTVRWYGEMLDNYVLPALGAKKLVSVTVGDVEHMTGGLGARGLSPRVQRAARVVTSKILHAAQKRDLVTRNVARLATAPKDAGKAKPQKALTPAETAAVLAALDGSRWYPVVALGFATGLRPGELLALHWADVKLDGRDPHLSVRHAVSHVGGATLKAPKRARSRRTVPISPAAVTVLRAWRVRQAEERLAARPVWSTEWPDLVFTTPGGRANRVDTYRLSVGAAVKVAGVPHFHPHMTRHTFATHLLEAGAPIHHVAELLGDTVATVEGAYSHVLRPKHETAALISTLFS